MQKIGACLWFDGEAEEAAGFYTSIFKNSKIVNTTRYLEGSPRPKGSVMTVLWEKLSAGGEEQQCGWLKDRYGVSWQIVPDSLLAMLDDSDTAASQRAVAAMLEMKKLNISLLERAYKDA